VKYYDILGVPNTATSEEIKRAYKKLAQKFHPDKAKDEFMRVEFEVRFKELSEAYEVLNNPDKRRRYDMGGESAVNQPGTEESARAILAAIIMEWITAREKINIGGPFNIPGIAISFEKMDMVADIKSKLVKDVKELAAAAKEQGQVCAKLRKLLGRVESNDENNIIETVILSKIASTKHVILQIKERKKIVGKVLELLELYKTPVTQDDEKSDVESLAIHINYRG